MADRGLRFLYNTPAGRLLLRPLISPLVSKAAGAFLDRPCSRCLIGPFVRKNRIDLRQYQTEGFSCFNDCFCRQIRPELRPIDRAEEALIAPCDGLLTACRLEQGTVLPVKQSRYTLAQLLDLPEGDPLVRRYENGLCLVFRLCVEHYHRYCYADSGTKGENRHIDGVLHTVRPVALAAGPVFARNSREYTVIRSPAFGSLLQMEVGAMLVGKIQNYHAAGAVRRGEEKGKFLYGGSTVILLLEPGAAALRPDLLRAAREGRETPVRMGERIGESRRFEGKKPADAEQTKGKCTEKPE